jgi:hypothetical protein
MIKFIDKNSASCGRTFYSTLVYYDHEYTNKQVMPVDDRYVSYSTDPVFYLVSHQSFYGDGPTDLTPRYIELARSGRIRLLYDFSFEAEWLGIQNFIDRMAELNIPETSYCILTGANFISAKPLRNICHCPMFEIKTRYCMTENLTHKFGITEHKNFLMLNARPRPHRVLLSYLLYKNGSFDNGHCSLPAENNVIEDYNFIESLKVEEKYGFEIDFNIAERMRLNLPFKVDNINYSDSLALNDSPFSDIYKYVNFVVITESLPDTGPGQVFITEKILKAVANKKPFLVLGDPNTLLYMRQLGYRTFDFLIDESYDSLPYTERAKKIASEVKRLCDVDFSPYADQLADVTNHNYNVLISKDTYTARIEQLVEFLSK